MLYTPYQYRACIRALGHSRRRTPKKAACAIVTAAVLFCICFAFQENHASLNKTADQIHSPMEKQIRPIAAKPPAMQKLPEEPLPTTISGHPGARDIWEQDFESILQKTILKVSSGDTLFQMLCNAGLGHQEAYQVTEAMRPVFKPADLRQGQELCLGFVQGPGQQLLQEVTLSLDVETQLRVIRDNDHHFRARITDRNLQTRPARFSAEIRSSLYQAALEQDLPIPVLMKLMRIYSYDVDFQRDIHSGDRIEILYEEKTTPGGRQVKSGDVLYAALHTNGRTLRICRHETEDGNAHFFDARGNSVRKALMVTPIDGAVVSSGYGMRKHPIQGYNKMHKGLDFAAPHGTQIMAAGDGIVTQAGPRGTYGNYVHIRHANDYETVYAHLSRYAQGIESGARVRQGETIGYVGSTGRSTGPHLHYEIRHAGQSINPSSLKAPPGRSLEGEEMKRFLATMGRLEKLYASLADSPRLAARAAKAGSGGPGLAEN